MALDPTLATERALAGQAPSRPTYLHRLEFPGDAAYATGGSAAVEKFVQDATGDIVTLLTINGYGYTAGALTHILQHDIVNDTLQVFVLATGAEAANAADLSGVTFQATVMGQ